MVRQRREARLKAGARVGEDPSVQKIVRGWNIPVGLAQRVHVSVVVAGDSEVMVAALIVKGLELD